MSEVLEDDGPAPPAPVAPAVPEPVATPEPVAPPDPDEAQAVEIQGGKHVPLAALKAAREDGKTAKAETERLKAEVEQMRGALATFQHLQRQPAAPAAVAPPVEADPDLIDLARSLDYFKTDGTLDLERAGKHQAIMTRQAMKIARDMMQPLQEQSAQQVATANYQQALNYKTKDGRSPSQAALNAVYSNLPAHLAANPDVARILPLLALGIDATNGGQLPPAPAAPVAPPVHTDGGGPARRPTGTITDGERMVLNARGMDDKTYLAHTKDFVKGRPNVLED